MRKAYSKYLLHDNYDFNDDIYLNENMILGSISFCYDVIDKLDEVLYKHSSSNLYSLIDTSNLSSILSNLLCQGIIKYSNSNYICNKVNTFPDIIDENYRYSGIEVKTAFNKNLPKGHLPKDGYYLIYRYCMTDEDGNRYFDMEDLWNTVSIWEVRFGYVTKNSFIISDTKNDSGKTAIIKTSTINNMTLLYSNPFLNPFKNIRI